MKPSADKDIKKYAETVQKLRENRNLSDDEFALLMGCSGTLRGGSCPGEERNCSIGAGSGYLRNRQDTFQSSR